MSFDDIEVSVNVRADTAELKSAIKDFDGTEAAVRRLQKATQDVKSDIGLQNQGIRALNQSYRVQTFELQEVLRITRASTSMFRDLNNVYQTTIQRRIADSAETLKQTRAYDDLKLKTENIVGELQVLGPANKDVMQGFQDINNQVKDLNSGQLQDVIDKLQKYSDNAHLSADNQKAMNKELDTLKAQLKETLTEEQLKRWTDFAGTFTTIATAAGSIGTFLVTLKKIFPNIGSGGGGGAGGGGSPGGAAQGAGLAGLFLSIFGPSIADTILASLGDKDAAQREAQRQLQGQAFSEQIGGGAPTVGLSETGQLTKLNSTNIHIENHIGAITGNADIDNLVNTMITKIRQLESSREK